MKRFTVSLLLITIIAAVWGGTASAQSAPELITLNDQSPAIDVVITLPADTTGTIALNLVGAGVTLIDDSGAVVFHAADSRLHALELNIAPNTGAHTLKVERLSGIPEAYVSVISLPELTMQGNAELVAGNTVNLNQEIGMMLSADQPGGTVAISLPADTTDVVMATFPGAAATTQLVDNAGVIVAESTGGHVDGLNLVIEGGEYQFTMLTSGLLEPMMASVRALTSLDGGFTVLEAPAKETAAIEEVALDCSATVIVSSVNMRSGPGTGYSVLNYGYRGESYVVGGRNPENNWLLVGTDSGSSAWISQGAAKLNGTCADLMVYNIPYREAQPAQMIITTSPSAGGSSSSSYEDHDDDDDGGDDEQEDENDDD